LSARSDGDAAGALKSAKRPLHAVYELPLLAHAPMEPMNCTADVKPSGCDLYVGTQVQQSAQAAAQQTVVAGQTATVVARQDEVGVRAAAQETAVAAQAQDTAVAQQTADAAVQQTVVAQETAVAVSQQVAAAQAVAQATANAPHDTPLGYWNHKCVVQSTNSDETITYDSDDTWAEGMCANVLAASSTLMPFPTNNARPGSIQCAFIHLYGSGLWREFSNYANPPSGDEQIAMRSTYWGDAAADCASIANWTA